MMLKISSQTSGNLSASNYASDPEKEISDEDDDDRNHKHRRQESHSQSSDKDVENISARPYRNQNRTFQNGHASRESKLQTRQHSPVPAEKKVLGKFGRGPSQLSQRNRANQLYSGDLSIGEGRGRDHGSWNYHNSMFPSRDIASQIVPWGTIPPTLFPDRGFPIRPNALSAPWGGYGLISGIANGSVETLHTVGLQGMFRPALSSVDIPRQQCRDFEERGFCLKGEVCPMEHGFNRIVVEDVRSLSQFNLPVSLSSGPHLGSSAVTGSLPSVGAASMSMMNKKGLHSNCKHGMVDDSLALKSVHSEPANVAAADLYDPDQPLWNNGIPGTSSAIMALHSSPAVEARSLLDDDAFENRMNIAADVERRDKTTMPVGSRSTSKSIWGGNGNFKRKTTASISDSDHVQNEIAENQEALGIVPSRSDGKRVAAEEADTKVLDSSNAQSDAMRLLRKPIQKALCTLFVNGIPQKNNRKEALLSHFQKFGKVIDIYIPISSERAFVQFSKREEAEAALSAPDAVMGNRFIKLRWANRDSIANDGISGVGASLGPHGGTSCLVSTALSVPSRGKDSLQSAATNSNVPPCDTSVTHPNQSKMHAGNSPNVPPPLQKKLELEHLKEELRKKQEVLDRKRSDFKRQLDELAKQATGVKGEDVVEEVAKRQRVELAPDMNDVVTLQSCDSSAPNARSSYAEATASCKDKTDNKNLQKNNVPGRPDMSSLMGPQESISSLKRPSHPSAPASMPFLPSRYKLDNRPTVFRILPPLPSGIANVAALKEHFSYYGDLTILELEDTEGHDNSKGSETTKSCSARIGFRDRQTAERAFLSSKSWQGHNLQLAWVASTGHVKANTNPMSGDNPSSSANEPSESNIQSTDKEARISSRKVASGEFEHSERETPADHAELAEVSESVPTSASSGKVD